MKTFRCLAALLCLLMVPAGAQPALQPGDHLPAFSETSLSGETLQSEALKGHPVVVWFTNFSDGSLDAAPELLEACTRRLGLKMVVISLTGPYGSRTQQFAERFSMRERTAVDSDGSTARAFLGSFMEGAVPLYNLFLFEPRGALVSRFHHPGVPPALLEKALQEIERGGR